MALPSVNKTTLAVLDCTVVIHMIIGVLTIEIGVALVKALRVANMRSILLYISEKYLKKDFNSNFSLCALSSKYFFTALLVMFSGVLGTLCMAKTHFINGPRLPQLWWRILATRFSMMKAFRIYQQRPLALCISNL